MTHTSEHDKQAIYFNGPDADIDRKKAKPKKRLTAITPAIRVRLRPPVDHLSEVQRLARLCDPLWEFKECERALRPFDIHLREFDAIDRVMDQIRPALDHSALAQVQRALDAVTMRT